MTKHFLLALLLLLCLPAHGAVYKWVDSEGNVHYGDTPPRDGAQQVDLPDYSRYAPRPTPSSTSTPASPAVAGAANPERYQRLAIVAPEPAGTVRSAQGTVTVQIEVEPPLGPDHAVALSLDGRPAASPVKGTSFRMDNVDRGTHVLEAAVVDAAGTEMIRSAPVRFTLRRPSLFDPARKPNDPTAGAGGSSTSNDDTPGDDGPGDDNGQVGDDDQQTDDTARDSAPFAPDYEGAPATGGRTNPDLQGDFRPSGNGISTTPGRTNPSFAPNYNP